MRFTFILSIFFISIIIFNSNDVNSIGIDLKKFKAKTSADIIKELKKKQSEKFENDFETIYYIPNDEKAKEQFTIDGKLNFFYSYSNQDYKASSFAPQMMETDNRLNFRYKNSLDEKNNFFY